MIINGKKLLRCKRCGWLKWDDEMGLTRKGNRKNTCIECLSDKFREYSDDSVFKEKKTYTIYGQLKRLDVSIARSENALRQIARLNSSITFRLSHRMSTAIRLSLNGKKSRMHWEVLVGFTIDELIEHLEHQFTEGMTWNNYGKEWHIDHIVPISSFNFTSFKDIDFKKCWSLPNLQPLYKLDNRKKGGTITEPYQFIKMVELDMLFEEDNQTQKTTVK